MTEQENNEDNETLKIILEILSDDGTPQDSIGNTRLTLLADKIKLSRSNPVEYRRYVWAINECAKKIPTFPTIEVENLCNLVYLAELQKDEFRNTFLDAFNLLQPTQDGIERRATVFRLIGEFSEDLELDFLKQGDDIKNEFPWYWIDVAIYMNRGAAIDATREWFEINKDIAPIIARLPHWWDLFRNKEEYYAMISELIKGVASDNDIAIVRSFLESFGVPSNKIDQIVGSTLSDDDVGFLRSTLSRKFYSDICPQEMCA